MTQAIISGIGQDRPGIVSAITEVLARHQGNIQDTSMTILGDAFAWILMVSLAKDASIDALRSDLDAVAQQMDLTLMVQPVSRELSPTMHRTAGFPFMISVSGADQAGITHAITQVLADTQVNITDLNAQTIDGEDGPVYILLLEVRLPNDLLAPELEKALKERARSLGVEVQLSPIDEAVDL
jgi:glycine cleavage system transcriptional repressor